MVLYKSFKTLCVPFSFELLVECVHGSLLLLKGQCSVLVDDGAVTYTMNGRGAGFWDGSATVNVCARVLLDI
jgi:hypothetical protein